MLSAVRRGPASFARLLCSTPANTALARRVSPRTSLQARSTLLIAPGARHLHSTPRWQRYAYAEADIEDDVEEELQARRNPPAKQAAQETKLGAITKFQELVDQNLVDEKLIRPITRDMGITTMTQVQSLTINETLKGVDVLAQARTGTGKTIAFLVPVLQNMLKDASLKAPQGFRRSRASSSDIRAIIISPTRELAEQIAVEARKLVKYTGITVQTAVGGSSKMFSLRQMQREGCHVLVGTPGRLVDLLSDEYSGVRAPRLSSLVLDEADRLLDQGFSIEIQDIQRYLPDREEVDRQTLLFSATVPNEVMQVVRQTMKPDFKFVRTVQEGEQPTHEKVPQKMVITEGFQNNLPALLELCKRELERSAQGGPESRPFKALVYFPTTAEVEYASQVFRNLRNQGASQFHNGPLHPARVLVIHSKLTQNGRTTAANSFRGAKSAILFSSDVTARGMDFPDVTHVIQLGLPLSSDAYVHRIGRTGRGEKSGEGWLLISQLEAREARHRLGSMPLVLDHSLQTSKVDMTRDAQLPENVAEILKQVTDATAMVDSYDKGKMYMAALGYYQWVPKKQKLIDALNALSKYGWGMETPPGISSGLVSRLGLQGLDGISSGKGARSDQPQGNSLRGRGASSFGRNDPSSYESRSRGLGDRESRDSSSRGGYGGRTGGSSSYGGRTGGSSSYGGRVGGSSSYGERAGGNSSYGERGNSGGSYGGGFGGGSSGGDRRSGFGGSSRGFDRDRGSSNRGGQGYGGGRGSGDRRGGRYTDSP